MAKSKLRLGDELRNSRIVKSFIRDAEIGIRLSKLTNEQLAKALELHVLSELPLTGMRYNTVEEAVKRLKYAHTPCTCKTQRS
jgi:hypothetical protein